MSLYEITRQYEEVLNDFDEETGEINFEALENINDAFEDKCLCIAAFIRNLQADELAIKEAIAAMKERKEKKEKLIVKLQDYVLNNMERLGIQKIDSSPYFEINLRKCAPSADVYDETQLSPLYRYERSEYFTDKRAILKALKSGLEIPGARLVTDKKSLQIK